MCARCVGVSRPTRYRDCVWEGRRGEADAAGACMRDACVWARVRGLASECGVEWCPSGCMCRVRERRPATAAETRARGSAVFTEALLLCDVPTDRRRNPTALPRPAPPGASPPPARSRRSALAHYAQRRAHTRLRDSQTVSPDHADAHRSELDTTQSQYSRTQYVHGCAEHHVQSRCSRVSPLSKE